MAQTIKVTILGTDYPLRSNDEALTRQLAADVDAEIRELQAKLPSQSTTTLAVLSALNFAEHAAHAGENEHRELERLTSEIETMAAGLERALEER
ncbi:MAG: cell division protein ZapA [Bacteroidota bacterium]|nr:cell division protein ZapA [Bacteroidota bacterium]MDP4234240.1 cell division protein ZapA [Bacteroidota bacterium]MDP4243430.1 cell division protein ZapA [Bacteroidota bacterium]MDP4288129.1 cell division protein ZapA [Bacteroidota bacterium]